MTTALVHHAASRGGTHPPGSLSGLRACLDAGAQIVELDITPLRDGQFALLHGPVLEPETNGSGLVAACTAEELSSLRRTWRGELTDEPVGTLQEALALIQNHPHPVELQLDLKPEAVLDQTTLSGLVGQLSAVKDRVRVTSVADWAVRGLRVLAPSLLLGFDPALYLDVTGVADRAPTSPPFRVGAYGYLDDHPLASRRWGSPAQYLSARAEALCAQAPTGAIWYIRATLLEQALDDGFHWIAYLHARGAHVDAWTLDPDSSDDVSLACRLADAGVDRITTNDPVGLSARLGRIPTAF